MTSSKFRRGSVSINLLEECTKLKQDIMKKGICKNERILTLPKLQDIILEKQKRSVKILPNEEILRILAG